MQVADFQKSKDKALELLNNYDITEPIVPAFEIAQRMGLKIVYFKPEDEFANVSGFLDPDKKIIYVNAEDPPHRQLYTVAHELGHFVLDHKTSDVLYRYATPIDKDPIEQEANCFAANLLVPEEMLQKIMKENDLSKGDVDYLAKIFGVSKDVIKFRLK